MAPSVTTAATPECESAEKCMEQHFMVQEELARRGRQLLVNNLVAEEQCIRIAMHKAESVLEEIPRKFNQKQVQKAWEQEKYRKIIERPEGRHYPHPIFAQVSEHTENERLENQRCALAALDEEKQRRERAGLPINEAAFQKIYLIASEAERAVNKKNVMSLEKMEKERRVIERTKLEVLENLIRHANQVEALRESDGEKIRRMTQDQKLEVMNDILRFANKRMVMDLCEKERENQVQEFAAPYGDGWDRKSTMNTKIISEYSRRCAIRASRKAQKEKALEEQFLASINEAVRFANQRNADRLVELEREERIQKGKQQKCLEELTGAPLASRGREYLAELLRI